MLLPPDLIGHLAKRVPASDHPEFLALAFEMAAGPGSPSITLFLVFSRSLSGREVIFLNLTYRAQDPSASSQDLRTSETHPAFVAFPHAAWLCGPVRDGRPRFVLSGSPVRE